MSSIINLTPHPIIIGDVTLPAASRPARAVERVQSADPISMDGVDLPTSWVTYPRLEDLPDPAPDVYYVVSLVVAQTAAACHRATADLLTPGEQVRDDNGRIIGCKSLARVGRGVPVFRWQDQRDAFVAESLRQGGSSDVSAERMASSLGRYARNYSSNRLKEPAHHVFRPGDLVTFFCSTRHGRGVHLTGVPFGTREDIDAAYALLASAGATTNDASAEECAIAAASAPDAIRAEDR